MSGLEFSEWAEFLALEPSWHPAEQSGQVAAVVANVNRDPKRRAAPYQPADFFPELREEVEPLLPETDDQRAALAERQIAQARMISQMYAALGQDRSRR